ncbi:methyltransferase type 11 [Methanomicrobiaceae archaeon CYW5]|uniref:class I SAM-dependent methyltransferase n=1 Tax=Methanovulcanius yangii TaxID=1789227 RepID=UPI0029C9CD01|nr:methyltransferase domain-containing protein [Methanovulcanius yangii]MBT8507584.1 methyltransferase type 11 [Methanovulcanius yangii]
MVPDQTHGKPRTPHGVHPPSRSGELDNRLRRVVYRPDRLAGRYIKPGDRVFDFGCGPGFFTREFAKAVGDGGEVIAADLQEEMLGLLRSKLEPEGLMPRIRTHRCQPDTIGLSPDFAGTIDAAFALFVVHEVPDPARLFREIATLLVEDGIFFYSEPPVLVPEREFSDTLALAEEAGFLLEERTWYFLNRAAVLRKV